MKPFGVSTVRVLSVTVRVAARVPVAAGAKVTLMVQLAPTATLAPQLLVCPKSPGLAPVMAMLVMLTGVVPVLVSATA